MRPGGASAARAAHIACADPNTSPARLAFKADAAGGSGPDQHEVRATIEPGCVTLEKQAGRAAAQRVRVPISSYRGIKLGLGERSVLTLLHEIEDFCVTLAIYDPLHDNDEDILSEGQRWAKQLGCALLLEEPDSSHDGNEMSLATRRPRARRANSFFAARRPRFLTRRATGDVSSAVPIRNAREIIART